jgi:hypothetical protein
MPHGAGTVMHSVRTPATNGSATVDPVFEEVGQARLKGRPDPEESNGHSPELDVRKNDLGSVLRRVKNHLSGPPTTNPKLVSYLAAGSIQGLRPMRYEKRVARNRFIAFALILLALLIGILTILPKHH